MRLWGSKPDSVTIQSLYYASYCYVSYLAIPDILIPAIANTQVNPPTWASPVSDPASLSATQSYFPTWESIVSVTALRLPTPSSLSLPVLVPNACPYPH